MRLAFLALLLVVLPPKPKAGSHLALSYLDPGGCPASGNCTVILSWTRPANFNPATDTARVVWAQTAPTSIPNRKTSSPAGTADTITLQRPPDGQSKAGTVTLCHTRVGIAAPSCNGALQWTVTAPVAPVPPVDTATGVKVISLLLLPPGLTAVVVPQGGTVHACVGATLSDGSKARALLPWPADCEPAYQAWVSAG